MECTNPHTHTRTQKQTHKQMYFYSYIYTCPVRDASAGIRTVKKWNKKHKFNMNLWGEDTKSESNSKLDLESGSLHLSPLLPLSRELFASRCLFAVAIPFNFIYFAKYNLIWCECYWQLAAKTTEKKTVQRQKRQTSSGDAASSLLAPVEASFHKANIELQ